MAEDCYKLTVGCNVATGRDSRSRGRRGGPNTKKYEERRPKQDHSFSTMPTVPEPTLRR